MASAASWRAIFCGHGEFPARHAQSKPEYSGVLNYSGGPVTCFKTIPTVAVLLVFWLTPLSLSQTKHASPDWRNRLHEQLPLLGHRNWIAIVDSAYPLQTSEGIETIETNGEQLEVVRRVLHDVAATAHLRPVVFTDAELQAVPEEDAPGVTYYRDSLNHFLDEFNSGNVQRQSLPHEEIIAKLDEA